MSSVHLGIRRALQTVALTGLLALGLGSTAALAQKIQEVTSPGGVKAWLVESHESAIITMQIAFKGGTVQEAPDKLGVAGIMAWFFNEGAGDLNTAEYSKRTGRIAAQISASAATETVSVNFSTVTDHAKEAFDLLELAFARPRFDADALARAKASYRNRYEQTLRGPGSIAGLELARLLYGQHPMALQSDVKAHIAALDAITTDDLKASRRALLARDNAVVSVAGDIDAATLGALLDRLFAHLPARADIKSEARVPEPAPVRRHIDMDIPQTIVLFGRITPELTPRERRVAAALDHILSGGMTARLFQDVREKRGLVYGVSAGYSYLRFADFYQGSFGSAPATAGQALDQTLATLARIAETGPTDAELSQYKDAAEARHLFDIEGAGGLVAWMNGVQLRNLPTSYIATFARTLQDITVAEVQAVARKLIDPKLFTVVSIGKADPSKTVQ